MAAARLRVLYYDSVHQSHPSQVHPTARPNSPAPLMSWRPPQAGCPGPQSPRSSQLRNPARPGAVGLDWIGLVWFGLSGGMVGGRGACVDRVPHRCAIITPNHRNTRPSNALPANVPIPTHPTPSAPPPTCSSADSRAGRSCPDES